MYQNIDNMICDADSCEAAICECKRMRKADITAAIIWAAVAVSAFLLILLDAILDINIGDVVAYILLFMLIAFPGICSTIYMIKHGTFGIFSAFPVLNLNEEDWFRIPLEELTKQYKRHFDFIIVAPRCNYPLASVSSNHIWQIDVSPDCSMKTHQ